MNFIPISKPTITELEISYVTDAVRSGWVSSLGEYIDKFEKSFAEYCGVGYAVATSNGTTALHLALAAAGVGSGDEVIVPDLTFVATANAVKYTGATPVIVDIEMDTLCIDPFSIEMAITPKTKAIIPVHLYGHPANMPAIMEIATAHGLLVIEDAAEAHGSTVNGTRVGGIGDAGVFSFYGNKIITSGEGGMITTNSAQLASKMRYLRDHAMSKSKRYWHTEVGFNYRMTNMQAALGLAQFERIESIIQKKNDIFEWYRKCLQGVEGLKINRQMEWAENVYWMICVELDHCTEDYRDNLLNRLKTRGVDGRPYFYPLSDMPMHEKCDTRNAHDVYKRGFNLPSYYDLEKKDVEKVCRILMEEL